MPLAVQALLPFAVLLVAAAIVRLRARRPSNGWIAAAATAGAAVIALIELLRLAPGERVDVPYLTTFPYADLAVRLDGLSLAFAVVTLVSAAVLMAVRQAERGDRRDPWTGWLLTSAASCAVIMAANLLLLYVLLQVLTLAWTGALDETAPRRRRLRLTLQIADIGLLLAAASAIQSVGTSSFSGVPSDTFGVPSFALMLLPVLVRTLALASATRPPVAAVLFAPAIAWVAPAGYVLMRLLALMGGRLPDRPTAVSVFIGAALAAIVFAGTALWARSASTMTSTLLGAQATLALSLSAGSEPLLTVACTWLWLLLIPVAGLASIRFKPDSPADALARLQLAAIPGSIAFTGIWLGALSLYAAGLGAAIIPIALAALLSGIAALRRLRLPRAPAWSTAGGVGVALLLAAALPGPLINLLVLPAASTVRLVPSGTVASNAIGVTTAFGIWPALLVSLLVVAGGIFAGRLVRVLPALSLLSRPPVPAWPSIRASWPRLPGRDSWRRVVAGWWARAVLWGAFAVVLLIALVRP